LPYEELQIKLTRILGEGGHVTSTAEQVDLDETVEDPMVSPVAANESTDDTMSYFAKLAES